jgi:hypothetical protein
MQNSLFAPSRHLLCGFTIWALAASAQALPVSFNAPRSYPVSGAPVAIVAGDFNGDGLADLAVAYNLTRTVAILLATSDGGFQPPVEYRVGQEPKSLAVGDSTGMENWTWWWPTAPRTVFRFC